MHGPTMITDNVQIRLHLFPTEHPWANHDNVRFGASGVRAQCESRVCASYHSLHSLSSQNSPSEPTVLWGLGNVPKRRAADQPPTLFLEFKQLLSSLSASALQRDDSEDAESARHRHACFS